MSGLYSAEDYAGAARALLPRGKVWPHDADTVQSAALLGIAQTFATIDSAAVQLTQDALPNATLNLLEEWEASLGLPDPCAGPNPTVEQRRAQVVAKFSGTGGQSRQFFINYAAALGFQIAITPHAPFRAGRSTAGDAVCGEEWFFIWSVAVLSSAAGEDASLFRVGHSRAGDPLSSGSYSQAVLQCEFERLKAAETQILFPA